MDNLIKLSGNEAIFLVAPLGARCSLRPPATPYIWPELNQLTLSDEEIAERCSGIGGSDSNTLLSGDRERVLRLWRQKRGQAPEEDLSNVLRVALGRWTEHFNRQWFEKVSGQSVRRCGESYRCPDHLWRRCTLDGFIESGSIVWEAKHTSAFVNREQVLERYMPQLQHNMAVMRSDRALLSVIFGNHRYEIIEVGADWLYQQELFEAERRFWECIVSGEPPVAVEPPVPPKPLGTRELCLEGNNAWAAAAADWLKHREGAKTHAAANALLKELVEEDVARAFGHGVEAKRSKSGAISIRELAR